MRNLGCIFKLVMIVIVLFFVLWLYGNGMRFFVQTYWWMFP
jgi:hypothetical protein